MKKKTQYQERKPAALSYDQIKMAIPKIDRRLAELNALDIQLLQSGTDPALLKLSEKLDQFITDTFGNDSHEYYKYHSYAEVRVISLAVGGTPIGKIRLWVQDKIHQAVAMLESIKTGFIETLEDAGIHGTTTKALKAYEGLELHPVIANAASDLFRDGYYADAIENAVKALNQHVRSKSLLKQDGVPLMQKAFSKENPILRFNALADDSDRSEQKGFMDWFCGTVSGLRNPRAHKIIKDDPEMALEFIAFISLQAKLVDKATVTMSTSVSVTSE